MLTYTHSKIVKSHGGDFIVEKVGFLIISEMNQQRHEISKCMHGHTHKIKGLSD